MDLGWPFNSKYYLQNTTNHQWFLQVTGFAFHTKSRLRLVNRVANFLDCDFEGRIFFEGIETEDFQNFFSQVSHLLPPSFAQQKKNQKISFPQFREDSNCHPGGGRRMTIPGGYRPFRQRLNWIGASRSWAPAPLIFVILSPGTCFCEKLILLFWLCNFLKS